MRPKIIDSHTEFVSTFHWNQAWMEINLHNTIEEGTLFRIILKEKEKSRIILEHFPKFYPLSYLFFHALRKILMYFVKVYICVFNKPLV